MTTKRQRESNRAIIDVTRYMQENPGVFHRITDVSAATGLAIPKVNNALRRLYMTGVVVSEMRKKKHNGKRYPVYLYYCHSVKASMPSWLCPPAPSFSKEQVMNMRTVLGFTGNLGLKEALRRA